MALSCSCLCGLSSKESGNVRTTLRRVCDARLWKPRMEQAQNLLHSLHIGGDERVNWSDDDWDDLWYKPADQ